jgi:hypothetical protein
LDLLFGKGAGDKGTLVQIKNYFGHRNVKKESDCMNHLVDFMDFVTEGHILLLASHLKDTDTDNLKDYLKTNDDVAAVCVVHHGKLCLPLRRKDNIPESAIMKNVCLNIEIYK